MSKYTYEVNKDKTVTIFREGSVSVVQTDDPATPGYDVFESKTRAEEWAKEAIAQYEADELREASLKNALGAKEKEEESLIKDLTSNGALAVVELGLSEAPAE